jgi:L-alanine-DL-glutamate epimerase-like enolase superfamily enzyme
MRIQSVEAVHVRVPLEVPYVFGRGTMTAFDSAIVRIESDDGIVGFGESVPLFRSSEGDASWVARMINGPVAERILGLDPFDVEVIVDRALETAGGNVDVVAGIDPAVWDILGKSLGQPVHRLIGGCCQELVAVDYTLGAQDPATMAEKARQVHEEGYTGVVVKTTGQLEVDTARTRAVREALPSDCTVRVDCNGAFGADTAVQFLKAIRDLDIEFVEQPVAAGDFEGLKRCRAVGIPISVDESLISSRDALDVVCKGACDVMNIKVPRVGGLLLSKRMAAIAASAGLPIVVGGRTTLEISRAASRHFAAATPLAVGRKHEGPGPASQALAADVVVRRTTRAMAAAAGGHVRVEIAPGLGVEVLWDQVERYAVREVAH